jgi:hypothetical protein
MDENIPYIKKCNFCEKEFEYAYGTQEQIEEWKQVDIDENNNIQFCNYDCKRKYNFNIKLDKINKDIANGKKPKDCHNRYLIFQRDNYRCRICGRSANDGVILNIDHWIPRKASEYKDNINDFDNLVVLCEECNKSKSDVLPDIPLKELLGMKRLNTSGIKPKDLNT